MGRPCLRIDSDRLGGNCLSFKKHLTKSFQVKISVAAPAVSAVAVTASAGLVALPQ